MNCPAAWPSASPSPERSPEKPLLMFYDEPTTGLDPEHSELIQNLIFETHQKGSGDLRRTTVIITHDRDCSGGSSRASRCCTRACFLRRLLRLIPGIQVAGDSAVFRSHADSAQNPDANMEGLTAFWPRSRPNKFPRPRIAIRRKYLASENVDKVRSPGDFSK